MEQEIILIGTGGSKLKWMGAFTLKGAGSVARNLKPNTSPQHYVGIVGTIRTGHFINGSL